MSSGIDEAINEVAVKKGLSIVTDDTILVLKQAGTPDRTELTCTERAFK